MLNINELLKICNSYDINSNNYGPSIFKNNKELGLCIDIKDSTYGYLTRKFIFKTAEEAEHFLNEYSWYQNNKEKYNLTISLNAYDIPDPKIIYKYNNKNLSFEDMLNIESIVEENKNDLFLNNDLLIFLTNIKELQKYLKRRKEEKRKVKEEKNKLKTEENDLKYELLKQLTNYYGKKKEPTKKRISLEPIDNKSKHNLENENIELQDKTIEEVKSYLKELINRIKEEELEEKNLVNKYSNLIYKYNIDILKKQIDFVNRKIASEKNFNLKGTKIHNIDAELKSFLNNSNPPISLEEYIAKETNNITQKYNLITDLKQAYSVISGQELNISKHKENTETTCLNNLQDLKTTFKNLDKETKASLILYNSFYKDICNYIFDNNYPSIENITKEIDIKSHYEKLKEVAFNENNNHYLVNYFNIIDFKDLTSYASSIINLCKKIETVNMKLNENQKIFSLNLDHTLKSFSINPSRNNDKTYIVDIPENTSIVFIPEKIILEDDTLELTTISANNVYLKDSIIETDEIVKVSKYVKKQEKLKKLNITVTKELEFKNNVDFNIGYIEEVLV